MAATRQTFDQLMKQFPQASYKDYSDLLELARKFGDDVVRQKLQAKPNSKPQPDKDDVLTLINEGLKLHDKDISKAVDSLYKTVSQQFSVEHTPRAKPALENENRLENNADSRQQRRLQQAPWMKNADLAADPKMRDAAIRQAVDNVRKNPASFTEQFKNVVKAEAEHRLAMKMKNMPRPGQSKKIEPKPY